MEKLNRGLFYLLAVFLVITFSSVCHAEYYWTIQKSADKNMVTVKKGQQIDVTYTIMVGVAEADGDDCMNCMIPATLNQCVIISENEENVLGQVCATRNMQPAFFRYTATIGPYDECGYYTVRNSVYLDPEPVSETRPVEPYELCCDSWTIYVKVTCEPPPPQEYEGCSQGYWKNHRTAWSETGYEPGDKVGDIFDLPERLARLENDTLLTALNYRGGAGVIGGARILFRQAVAALLNAGSLYIDYPATPERIILNVNDALETLNRRNMLNLKNELDKYNNMGCPLD